MSRKVNEFAEAVVQRVQACADSGCARAEQIVGPVIEHVRSLLTGNRTADQNALVLGGSFQPLETQKGHPWRTSHGSLVTAGRVASKARQGQHLAARKDGFPAGDLVSGTLTKVLLVTLSLLPHGFFQPVVFVNEPHTSW